MPTFLFRAVFLVSAFFPTWVFGQNRSENPWQWSCRNRLVLAGTDLVPEDQAKIETVETVPVKGGRVARNEPDQVSPQRKGKSANKAMAIRVKESHLKELVFPANSIQMQK